ncbi:MAG: selenide, water dikinase SelD [Helicobacter sp.]|nr:selenide, water dikinase SelD [Helicobacter sp.]MDY5741011.1 selenide, water dikinase SelD [Helicobacter sp.]
MGPEDLKQLTSSLIQADNPNVLAGFDGSEDCGAYAIDKDKDHVVLSSVDFITPIVDDPYAYGCIAAANSLSDIFACGGRAVSALNLFMWDRENVDLQAAKEILRGGLDKIKESQAVLLGGHTTSDIELKYGLSVTGMVSVEGLWRNNTARIGDMLVLCKPIGSGILSTALKAESLHDQSELVSVLSCLNFRASQVAKNYEIHACTDITGFGLVGHIFEMCKTTENPKGFDKTILLYTQEIPLFSCAIELVKDGFVPGGTYVNKQVFAPFVEVACDLQEESVFYDVQTSGGLVFALPAHQAKKLTDDLRQSGYEQANIIGEVLEARDKAVILG